MASEPVIAVIGAGIAGAACCLRLAHLGYAPLWIAPREPARDKPGELLSAAARPMLATLGAADLLQSRAHRPAYGMFSAWGSANVAERSSILHLEGPQTVLNRGTFEEDLIARAEQSAPPRETV